MITGPVRKTSARAHTRVRRVGMAVLMILSLLALQGQFAVADGGDGAIALTPGGLGTPSPTTPPAVTPDPDENAPASDGGTAGKTSGRSSNN